MANFSWLAQEKKLSNASLTVRAQAISPNDEGRLLWDGFFPRRDVDSVKIGDIITGIDFELAKANLRRIEVDAFTAWALGQVTVMDPVRGATTTVSYGFPAARYETAGTAWDNAGVNAYQLFLDWLSRAVDLVGPIQGVMLRLATLNAIKADAPNPFSNVAGIALTRAQLEQRVQDELGSNFAFFVNENTQDIFTDGGIDVVRTKVWPTGRIAAVPAGDVVGYTAFAPVARAFEVSRAAPEAEIDVRGQTVYIETGNNGRDLTNECQVNAFTVPNENLIAVVNAGV
jgi:hypothetical protein